MLLSTVATKNHQKFCARAQMIQGMDQLMTSKMTVALRRPNLSVAMPPKREATTWKTIPMDKSRPICSSPMPKPYMYSVA